MFVELRSHVGQSVTIQYVTNSFFAYMTRLFFFCFFFCFFFFYFLIQDFVLYLILSIVPLLLSCRCPALTSTFWRSSRESCRFNSSILRNLYQTVVIHSLHMIPPCSSPDSGPSHDILDLTGVANILVTYSISQ